MSILKKIANDTIYGNKLTSSIRILLGIMFIFSGIFKTLDLESFGNVIKLYGVFPEYLIPYPAIIIPFLELVLGLFLLVGYKVRASALISILIMIMFTFFIAVNVAKGKNFDCGCFELNRLGIGINENLSASLIFRDLVIIFLFFIVFLAKRHIFSLENLIEDVKLKNL